MCSNRYNQYKAKEPSDIRGLFAFAGGDEQLFEKSLL
jgi:hypothetical protein